MLAHVSVIAGATDLPVSGDLENGFGDDPDTVAATIRGAAGAGLVGGSIEDSTGRADAPLYDPGLAVERVQAAAEAARSLPFPFMLTARAETYLVGRADLYETISVCRRIRRRARMCAPGLAASYLSRRAGARTTGQVTSAPGAFVVADLSRIGVKRVSVGSALFAAFGALLDAGRGNARTRHLLVRGPRRRLPEKICAMFERRSH